MREKIINFLKSKFNITLIVLQIFAIVFYCLAEFGFFFIISFFVLEGSFFITLGVKILLNGKKITAQQEVFSQLPYSEEERLQQIKKNQNIVKNNKFIAIALIVLGIILILSLFSAIKY